MIERDLPEQRKAWFFKEISIEHFSGKKKFIDYVKKNKFYHARDSSQCFFEIVNDAGRIIYDKFNGFGTCPWNNFNDMYGNILSFLDIFAEEIGFGATDFVKKGINFRLRYLSEKTNTEDYVPIKMEINGNLGIGMVPKSYIYKEYL